MRPVVLHCCRLLFPLIPETRLFGLKAALLRAAGARIGQNVRICSSVRVFGSGDLDVGDGSWLGHAVMICATSRVTIGNAVDVAPRVYIGTGTHEIDADGARSAGVGRAQDVTIESGAWIGAGSLIMPGVCVGSKAIVAAGAVVTGDVPSRTVAGGVPAKVIRYL